jgi:2,4-dienoyl-CoA reductase-like NADH-dependent reductase (Old Yellow Enzyme family)
MADTTTRERPGAARDLYPLALSPLKIGPVEVRNRIFMAAHGIGLVAGASKGCKFPSDEAAFYYGERAAGGAGLVIHSQTTNPSGFASPLQEESVPSFRVVAEAVHRHGGKIFAQLWTQPAGTWDPMSPARPMLGASDVPRIERFDDRRGLSGSAVRTLIQTYIRCTANLAAAGYDGVEIHTAHGMPLQHFLSPFFNQRTDEYGGDQDRRMRVLIEILKGARAAMGPTRAVGIRLACDELLPGGITQDYAKAVLTKLIDLGLLDFVNLDSALAPQRSAIKPHFVPPLAEKPFVESVGAASRGRTVTMSVLGGIKTMTQAEEALAAGIVDMVGIGRGLIAEPNLVRNALEGREDRSRACIRCNSCVVANSVGAWTCAINPATGKERLWGGQASATAARPGKVVVVGGGPAGLEAARAAALLGHRVVLMERAAALGGQLLSWGSLPDREHLRGVVDWQRDRLQELGVEVRLGRAADTAAVLAEKPDAVIVATGALYSREGVSGLKPFAIPGAESAPVFTPEDILAGARPTGRVLVLDEEGLHAGVGIAEMLAKGGAQVELVTSQPQVAGNLVAQGETGIIRGRLNAAGVRVTPGAYVKSLGEDEAVVYDLLTQKEERRAIDAVVLTTRRRSVVGLEAELEGKVGQVFLIGDALSPRGLVEATYEGHRFARLVGVEGAPATTDDALMAEPDPRTYPSPAATLLAAV